MVKSPSFREALEHVASLAPLALLSEFGGGVLRLGAVVVFAEFVHGGHVAFHVRLIAAGEVGAGVLGAESVSHLFHLGLGHVHLRGVGSALGGLFALLSEL